MSVVGIDFGSLHSKARPIATRTLCTLTGVVPVLV
jgi:hypothetical protein